MRLDDAGENRSAWITLLTTEHYNLQTSRAATISEANGRASIFLGSVSAGLIALGFQGGDRSAATTTFQVVVLSALASPAWRRSWPVSGSSGPAGPAPWSRRTSSGSADRPVRRQDRHQVSGRRPRSPA
jgi:hypothetical protein